jgi:hypothetical protein
MFCPTAAVIEPGYDSYQSPLLQRKFGDERSGQSCRNNFIVLSGKMPLLRVPEFVNVIHRVEGAVEGRNLVQ